MTLSSVYAQKMTTAANSPRKRSARETFVPSIIYAREPAAQHPAERWLKSSQLFNQDQILAGTVAALLTMKKPDKIVPISLLSPSPTFQDKFEGHGHHLLGQPVCIHVDRGHITNHVLSLLTKVQADSLGFDYVDASAVDGLPNIADPALPNFVPPVIPANMIPTDAMDYLVIALIPITCPIGYGKECPVGNITEPTTTTALQNNNETLFAWALALDFLRTNHGGRSLHKLIPDTTRITHYLPQPQRDDWSRALTDEIWVEPAAMSPEDNDYKNAVFKVDALANHLVDKFIVSNDNARVAYQNISAASTNSNNTSDLQSAMTSAFASINNTTGSTTTANPSTKKFNSMAFRLLCVYTKPNDVTGRPEWKIPNDINEKFESMIKGTVRAGMPMKMWRSLKKFLNNLRTVNHDYATLNCELQTYNKQFWVHLIMAAWETSTITESRDLLESTCFTPFNLANMEANTGLKQENLDIISEDLQDKAGWASDARIKSSTTMSHNFDVKTFAAVVGLMSNTSTFIQFVTSDKHFQRAAGPLPFLAQKTEDLIELLHHHEGRSWRNVMDHDYPWTWFKIAIRYSNIFAMQADYALGSFINSKAQQGNDIDDDEKKLERVKLAFKQLEYDIASAQESGEPNAFGSDTPPTIWKEVCESRYEIWKRRRQAELEIPTDGQKYHTNSNQNNYNGNGNAHGRQNNHGGRGGRGGHGDGPGGRGGGGGGTGNSHHSSRGVFIKTDPAKPFIFDQTCPVPTFRDSGMTKDLCLRFATRNAGGCIWGNRCNKYHLTKQTYTKLVKSKQIEVALLVHKTTNLEFTHDCFKPDKSTRPPGAHKQAGDGGSGKKAQRGANDDIKQAEKGKGNADAPAPENKSETNEGQH
jgi:hypothetical protein